MVTQTGVELPGDNSQRLLGEPHDRGAYRIVTARMSQSHLEVLRQVHLEKMSVDEGTILRVSGSQFCRTTELQREEKLATIPRPTRLAIVAMMWCNRPKSPFAEDVYF